MHQHRTLEDTVYFWFASNDTSGSGDDGATPLCDVRLAGATITDAPILSPTPALISHVNYPAGCYEVAVAATDANGFAATNTYAVFCALTVDSQNPTGFVGSFTLDPIIANIIEVSDDATAAANAELFFDGTGYAGTNNVIPTVTTVNGLGANVVTAAAVADGAIDAATFAAGAINAAAIATNAVDADALATDAITEIVTAMLTTQMTEAYAADTVAPTLAQILFMIWSLSAEKAIVTTTVTAKKLDGATTSMTFTLNDQTNPTSITRAT